MARLLLIDDDSDVLLDQVARVFGPGDLEITFARGGLQGLAEVEKLRPHVVLLDVSLPDLSGLEVYRRIRQIDARIPVIFITATAGTDAVIEAMRNGAFDYLFKPLALHQLEQAVREALEVSRLMREPASVGGEAANGDSIIGRSPQMREVYKSIGRVADQNVIVLITGESGTGKELVARAIYQHSDRSKAPFLAINCAAIPENLLESEMFGHERGAFTGADRRRIGKFEQCNGGTIFLDEIGDMPLATQGKILRLLQDQRFERVGGNETIRTDVRLLAATNRDLKTWSDSGSFRLDLYFRLNVFQIELPPLRERGDDVSLLVHFYLKRFNRELGREVCEVDPQAMDRLRRYPWPGNVRELQSVLKQALLRARGKMLLPTFLPDLAEPIAAAEETDRGNGNFVCDGFIRQRLQDGSETLHADAHDRLDHILLTQVMRFTHGNQAQAAKVLGIARQTLRNRLLDLGLVITKPD
jgi:DNA-binding NtrC family response regulator